MEYLVVILLVFIAYQLYKSNAQKENKDRPAFTEEEWNKVVAEYYFAETARDKASGLFDKPFYSVWHPPSYDEAKYNRGSLNALREMIARLKN